MANFPRLITAAQDRKRPSQVKQVLVHLDCEDMGGRANLVWLRRLELDPMTEREVLGLDQLAGSGASPSGSRRSQGFGIFSTGASMTTGPG
jgi:hypothetical protein